MGVVNRINRLIRTTYTYASTKPASIHSRNDRRLGSYTVKKKIDAYEDPTKFKRTFNEELAKYAAITCKHILVVDGPSANSSRIAELHGINPSKIHAVTYAKDYDQMKEAAPIGANTYKANALTMFQTDFGDNMYPVGQIMNIQTIPFGVMYFDLMGCTPNHRHTKYREYCNFINTLMLYNYLEKGSMFALTTSFFAMQKICQQTYCTTEKELEQTITTLFSQTNTPIRVLTCKKYRKHMCFLKILIC
jgi:hypothetical protein